MLTMMAMDMIGTFAQILLVIFLLAFLAYGIRSVAVGLRELGNSPQQITNKTNVHLEQIAREGMRAMDNLSEQYLRDLFDQVTGSTNSTSQRR